MGQWGQSYTSHRARAHTHTRTGTETDTDSDTHTHPQRHNLCTCSRPILWILVGAVSSQAVPGGTLPEPLCPPRLMCKRLGKKPRASIKSLPPHSPNFTKLAAYGVHKEVLKIIFALAVSPTLVPFCPVDAAEFFAGVAA
eukprot:13979619-Alexandrium_andersonii.AAC.1